MLRAAQGRHNAAVPCFTNIRVMMGSDVAVDRSGERVECLSRQGRLRRSQPLPAAAAGARRSHATGTVMASTATDLGQAGVAP